MPAENSYNFFKYDLAYEEALSLIKELLATSYGRPIGYYASSVDLDNYKRLFTRDTIWIGLAALLSGKPELIEGFKSSLDVLCNVQREDGAIPSNISPGGLVSFGANNPRIDPNTLYVIGCIEYYKYAKDEFFIRNLLESINKTIEYLEENWENKEYELLYIPRAGNWADEYLQRGLVLYDEVLWYQALKSYAYILRIFSEKKASAKYLEKANRVRTLIRDKFWIKNSSSSLDKVYLKMRDKIDFEEMGYLMHFYYAKSKETSTFSKSHGIFDAFGNSLAILSGVASKNQVEKIFKFVDVISQNKYPLIPAHYPCFKETVFRSKKLHQYRFKEYMGKYHNGGLWSWYTGIYAASMVKIGDYPRAIKFLEGILNANMQSKNGEKFYEYHAARKSILQAIVDNENGLDLYFSKVFSDYVRKQKPNVQIEQGNKKIEIVDEISVRNFPLKKNEKIKITAVGPNAEDVLYSISSIEDRSGKRYFRDVKVEHIVSQPEGTSSMGISAAAYIIAYKAVKEGKVLFYQ